MGSSRCFGSDTNYDRAQSGKFEKSNLQFDKQNSNAQFPNEFRLEFSISDFFAN